MGASDLRDAFNDEAGGKLTCARATLQYLTDDTVQYQILTFYGTDWSARAFEVKSERLRPETDVMQAARAVARKFVDEHYRETGS